MHLPLLLATLLAATPDLLWRAVPLDGGGPVTALACSPVDPALLLSGGLGAGVLRSSDGGRSWERSDDGLFGWGDRCVAQLLWHPTDGARAYACLGTGHADGGLFASADGGRHWLARSRQPRFDATGQSRHVLLAEPLDPGQLWAATLDDGVCWSADDGQTWTSLGPEGRRVDALARAVDGTLYAAVAAHTAVPKRPGGLFRRRPGEPSWTLVFPADLVDVGCTAGGALLVASAEHGLLRSEDGGLRYENVTPAGLRAGARLGLEVSAASPTVAVAWGEGRPWQRVWLTIDSGLTWRQMVQPPGRQVTCADGWMGADSFGSALACAAFDPHSARRLWLGDEHTLWYTHDGAASWASGHSGLRTATIAALAADAARPDAAYLGTLGSGAFLAEGASVVTALGGNGVDLRDVTALATVGRAGLPVLARDRYVWQRTQPGRYRAGQPLAGPVLGLSAVPDGALLAEVKDEPPALSRDAGLTWQTWGQRAVRLPLVLDGGPRQALALGWDQGLWRTRDGGASWASWTGDLPSPPQPGDLLAGGPTSAGPFYLQRGEALWRTVDGSRWERMLPKPLRALAVDAESGTIYAAPAEGGGLLVSSDQGNTWVPLAGAPPAPITVLRCGSGGRLWVGTRGAGAWLATPRR